MLDPAKELFSFNKIALFIPNLDGGGAERVFINLARIFIDFGLDVDLVAATATGSLAASAGDIRVVDLKTPSVAKCIGKLRRYISGTKPDVIISALPHANLAAIIAAKLSGGKVRVVCTVHEDAFSLLKHISLYDKLILRVMKLLYPTAKGIIAVSEGLLESQRRYYGRALPASQIAIYNPIIPRESDITQLRIPKGDWSPAAPFNIISVGRLRFEKDFKTLIHAFSLLPDLKNARLTIYGEGPERGNLERLIKELSIEPYVSLPGFTNDIVARFKEADLFVMSSIWEGFGNVVVEAMAAGCPIISTDCRSGPGEILGRGKYGDLVPVGDEREMAQAMERAMHGNIVVFDTKVAADRFLFRNIGGQYLQFFEKCYY